MDCWKILVFEFFSLLECAYESYLNVVSVFLSRTLIECGTSGASHGQCKCCIGATVQCHCSRVNGALSWWLGRLNLSRRSSVKPLSMANFAYVHTVYIKLGAGNLQTRFYSSDHAYDSLQGDNQLYYRSLICDATHWAMSDVTWRPTVHRVRCASIDPFNNHTNATLRPCLLKETNLYAQLSVWGSE